MKLTAEEIIPDMLFASDGEVDLNLCGARYMLDKFLRIFSRAGKVNRDCLHKILQMDLEQAREFFKDDTNADDSINPVLSDEADSILATVQMMVQAYLSEQMATVNKR